MFRVLLGRGDMLPARARESRLADRGTRPRSGASRATSQLVGVELGGLALVAVGAGLGGELSKRVLR